jgi:hypothetical protein
MDLDMSKSEEESDADKSYDEEDYASESDGEE